MVLSAVSVFFFWFVDTELKMLVMSCFFSALSVAGWNALDHTYSLKKKMTCLQSFIN